LYGETILLLISSNQTATTVLMHWDYKTTGVKMNIT